MTIIEWIAIKKMESGVTPQTEPGPGHQWPGQAGNRVNVLLVTGSKAFVECVFFFGVIFCLRCTSDCSLDKILTAMTIAAERNNKDRFAPIVEGLENHDAQQLQVHTRMHARTHAHRRART